MPADSGLPAGIAQRGVRWTLVPGSARSPAARVRDERDQRHRSQTTGSGHAAGQTVSCPRQLEPQKEVWLPVPALGAEVGAPRAYQPPPAGTAPLCHPFRAPLAAFHRRSWSPSSWAAVGSRSKSTQNHLSANRRWAFTPPKHRPESRAPDRARGRPSSGSLHLPLRQVERPTGCFPSAGPEQVRGPGGF